MRSSGGNRALVGRGWVKAAVHALQRKASAVLTSMVEQPRAAKRHDSTALCRTPTGVCSLECQGRTLSTMWIAGVDSCNLKVCKRSRRCVVGDVSIPQAHADETSMRRRWGTAANRTSRHHAGHTDSCLVGSIGLPPILMQGREVAIQMTARGAVRRPQQKIAMHGKQSAATDWAASWLKPFHG